VPHGLLEILKRAARPGRFQDFRNPRIPVFLGIPEILKLF
jgi:hypothetical protein